MANLSSDQDQDHSQPKTESTNSTAVVDLDYPQILLKASFTSLLSSSFPSPSDSQITAMLSESPARSLSESWASLSTSDFSPEDDVRSETTDIVSLVGTNASEDLQSTDNDEEEKEQQEDDNDEAVQDLENSVSIATPSQLSTGNIRSSESYNSIASVDTTGPNPIRFEDVDSWPSVGRVDLRKSVKVFNQKERADLEMAIPRASRTPHIVGTIRMTTSKAHIRRDRPFRLLYSGPNDAAEIRAQILRKIGDVLVATLDMDQGHNMDTSRYHVMPFEFGPGSSPTYAELIPLQFQQMIVDDCVDAMAFKKDSAHSQILLNYKGGQSILSMWDGNGFRLPKGRGWDPPDFAIVYVREDDSSARKLFNGLIGEFMGRHNIPTLVVREDNEWTATYDHIVVNTRSLHMCVESRSTNTEESGILKILPVDLATFVNLDATQLNRHIACLSDIYRQVEERKIVNTSTPSQEPHNSQDLTASFEKEPARTIDAKKRATGFFEAHQQIFWSAGTALGSLILLYCCYFLFSIVTLFLIGCFQSTTSLPISAASTSAQPIASVSTTFAIEPTVLTFASQSSLQIRESAIALAAPSVDKHLARMISNAVSRDLNKSENFQVQILGDGHFVVKAPQKIVQKRNAPKVDIHVMRGSIEIPSNTSKLFDGLYTVKIHREHANGLLNVSINVQRPAITERYELDFGNPWLSADGWKDAVQRIWSPMMKKTNASRTTFRAILGLNLMAAQGKFGAATLKAMEIAKNKSTEYGPTIRKFSLQAQGKSKELLEKSAYRAGVAANSLTQDAHAAYSELETYSRVAGDTVNSYMQKLFSGVKATVYDIQNNAPSIDLGEMRDKVMDSTRSEALARAQERARQIVHDAVEKLNRRAESGCSGKIKPKTQKKMRGSKKPWHSNARVNW